MKKIIFIFSLLLSIPLIAQDCTDLVKYTNAIEKADSCITMGNYKQAQNYYNAAEIYCKDSSENIKNAKDALFNTINQLRVEADSLIIKTKIAISKIEQEQAKNKKIINAFYFYEDKLAIAYNNGYYGFIDKEGNVVINYKYYEALPFDNETGFAKAKKHGTKDYILIDANAIEYQFEHILNKDVLAVNWENKKLRKFSKSICNSPQIQGIILSKNKISKIPKEIRNLTNLAYLDLSDNFLSKLPKEISELYNLTHLNLSNNYIREIPEEILKLYNLTHLNLSDNYIKEIPREIAQLQNLRKLDLSYTHIKEIPKEISQLKKLNMLYLTFNEIKEIPKEIAQLQNLRKLDLSVNYISSLPKEIENLINLKDLRLDGNKLTSLPKEVANLQNLKILHLHNNKLTSLPKEMANLQNLKELYLDKYRFSKKEKKKIQKWLPNCVIHYHSNF